MSSSWLAAQGRLPLAFISFGLGGLATAAVVLTRIPEILALPHVHPHVVALAHIWMLGFFVPIACGAVYQLAPVALGTTLVSERLGWWHFWLHLVGVPGMVASFWIWDMKWLGHFGMLVATGIGFFSANVWRTVKCARRPGVVSTSLVLAAVWVLLTVIAGLVLAANRFWGFLPLDPLALLRAHAHLGLVGFFLTLIQGVSFQLVPMFTLAEVRDWTTAKRGLWLSQTGLLILEPGLAWSWAWISAVGAALITAGVASSARALLPVIATRKKRRIDPGLGAFFIGAGTLVLAAIAGLALVAPRSPWGSAPGGFSAMIYGVLVIAGGLLPCTAGMLCKIVPFLTWMRAYGPKLGRAKTPSANALNSPRLEKVAFALQLLALLPLLAGIWTLNTDSIRIGAWLLAAGLFLFLADMVGVMRHIWRPQAGNLILGTKTSP
jgi:hypothetical protein